MKKSYFTISFIVLMVLVLTACNSSHGSSSEKISLDDEFNEYRSNIIEPLNERSLKIAEMGGHFATIIEETEEAYNYLNEELIPFAKEAREVAVDEKNSLINREIIELNDMLIRHFDLTIESFTMTAEMMKLKIPPFSDEEYEEAEKIYNDNLELQKEIDRISSEFDAKVNELAGD